MRKLIGNKKFYKMVLAVAVPIMIQNGITNFVNLLDNIMVGQIGTESMSAVAIINQLFFVFNICIFGAISGASIFGAQFYGKKDYRGMRDTFRFKIIACLLMSTLGIFIFNFFGSNLISAFLHEGGNSFEILKTLEEGNKYLAIMMVGTIPFAIGQAYSSTLREMGQTLLPMFSSIAAVLVNLVFNYILIFGKFGLPAFGVEGAAIATVLARFIECGIIILWTHKNKVDIPFIIDAYKNFHIPIKLIKNIAIKGSPLMINEALWSGGMAVMVSCYSVRGLQVIAGINISNVISNVFNIVFIAMGSSISIIVGQLLGAGKMEEARDTDAKLIFFSVISCVAAGFIMALLAPIFPRIYNTSFEVRALATKFILISGLCMPMYAFMHATYFTLRSGGKTIITFLFDSVFLWVVSIPLAYLLTRHTGLNIIPIYFLCQIVEIIKCIIGYILVNKGVWLNNIVANNALE